MPLRSVEKNTEKMSFKSVEKTQRKCLLSLWENTLESVHELLQKAPLITSNIDINFDN
jgi:hypothetical protein